MPLVLLPVPDANESITRPVIINVMREVMENTGISQQTNVTFPGDLEKNKQLGTSISLVGDDPNKFPFNDKVSIDVVEDYDPDRIITEAVYGPENLPIFNDMGLGIAMKPVYSMNDVTITVKYRAENHTLAIRWRDMIRMRLAQKRALFIHDLTYHYAIPLEYLYILKELWKLREAVDGYGDTYDEYFEKYRQPRITEITNLNGSASVWVMPETQMRIQGWFDFETPDHGNREDDTDTWTISFSYKFRYSKPIGMVMSYPLMVHNQLIPQKLREAPVKTEDDIIETFSLSGRVLNQFYLGKTVSNLVKQHRGYCVPSFDDFVPSSVQYATMRLITILFTIDKVNPTLFLNLTQLGDKKFSPEIIAFLKEESQWLTQPYQSVLSVGFYRNQYLIEPSPIVIDSDLNITGTTPIRLRDTLHIRVGLVTDLTLLTPAALLRLRNNGLACLQILETINPSLKRRGLLPTIPISAFVWQNLLNLMSKYGSDSSATAFNTVQTLIVQADNMNNLPK